MMAGLMFLGDEASAAGFRLAGARILSPPPEQAARAFRDALHEAPALLMLSAEYAQRIPAAELERALAASTPLLLLVSDVESRVPAPDLAAQVRRQLGLGA